MIKISYDDLENMEQVGSGKFGIVYQATDDICFKIYKDYVMGRDGVPIFNPALKFSKAKLIRLLERAKKVQYTDLIQDVVVVDGFFGGYSMIYYPGCTLETYRHAPYELKKDVISQLLRNDQELKDNLIYPLDYHLGNVMVDGTTTKIIDLDDPLTKVTSFKNPLFNRMSVGRLNDTIQDFFQEYDVTIYRKKVMKQLQRKRYLCSYKSDWFDSFIKEKEEVLDYLIMRDNSNIEEIRECLQNNDYRVLYQLDEKIYDEEYLISIIKELKKDGIDLFDFIIEGKEDYFFHNFPVENKIMVEDKPYVLTK